MRTIALIATSPLWVPVYLVAGLCGLCTDGLVYVIEERLGRNVNLGLLGRIALALPSLLLFPALSTVEVSGQFLLSAGRWPRHLLIDGLLTAVFGVSVGMALAWTGYGTWIGLAAGLLMALWLVAGNTLPSLAWLSKGLTALAVAVTAGVASLLWAVSEVENVTLALLPVGPAVALLAALALTVRWVLVRKQSREYFFVGSEPTGLLGNALALLRGALTVLLMPAWFPVLAGTWLVNRIFGDLILPDINHRLDHGGVTEVARTSRFSSYIGLRYMKGKRDQRFVSVITVLSIVAVMMGVWTLTVVLSVMSGFEVDLRDKILGTNSHVVALNYVGTFPDYREKMETIETVDGVVASTPFIYTELMVKHNDQVTGAIFKGIDQQTVGDVTAVVTSIKKGPEGLMASEEEKQAILDGLDDPIVMPDHLIIPDPDQELPGALIGEEMATALRVVPGDVLLVTSPFGEPGPFGALVTTVRKFRVKAIFYSGMYEYDAKFVYVSIPSAQEFLKFDDEVTGIEVVVDDLYGADRIARDMEEALAYPFWTRDWMKMNKNLFEALKLEKRVMAVILSFIYVGAALNIIVVLIMVVMEKQKEIAILRAMGAAKDQIMKAFMIEGLIIGFVGTTVGTVLGYATCLALARYRLVPLNTDVYYLDTLPVDMDPWTFVGVALFAIVVSILATLYPAWNAAQLDPVEGLRYE